MSEIMDLEDRMKDLMLPESKRFIKNIINSKLYSDGLLFSVANSETIVNNTIDPYINNLWGLLLVKDYPELANKVYNLNTSYSVGNMILKELLAYDLGRGNISAFFDKDFVNDGLIAGSIRDNLFWSLLLDRAGEKKLAKKVYTKVQKNHVRHSTSKFNMSLAPFVKHKVFGDDHVNTHHFNPAYKNIPKSMYNGLLNVGKGITNSVVGVGGVGLGTALGVASPLSYVGFYGLVATMGAISGLFFETPKIMFLKYKDIENLVANDDDFFKIVAASYVILLSPFLTFIGLTVGVCSGIYHQIKKPYENIYDVVSYLFDKSKDVFQGIPDVISNVSDFFNDKKSSYVHSGGLSPIIKKQTTIKSSYHNPVLSDLILSTTSRDSSGLVHRSDNNYYAIDNVLYGLINNGFFSE